MDTINWNFWNMLKYVVSTTKSIVTVFLYKVSTFCKIKQLWEVYEKILEWIYM